VILVDTGPLYALAAKNDEHHAACARLADERWDEFVVPTSVIPETCYMLGSRLGAEPEAVFLDMIATGELATVGLDPEDYGRTAELVRQYADLRLGAVDASLVAVAERLGVREIATVNPRDFTVVRPRHVSHFELLP
jgi:uncharacterized protein